MKTTEDAEEKSQKIFTTKGTKANDFLNQVLGGFGFDRGILKTRNIHHKGHEDKRFFESGPRIP